MKKEDFFEVLGELDDDIVNGVKTPTKKKINWKGWGAMAACLCLVAAGGFAIQNSGAEPGVEIDRSQPDDNTETIISETAVSISKNTNHLVVNALDGLLSDDMDVEYTFYAKLPQWVWEQILNDFREFSGIRYHDFIARVPDTWEHVNFYSLAIRGYKDADLGSEYRLHDYVFDFRMAEDQTARIALCSSEEPLRDYFVSCDNPKQSEINGIPVFIYGFNDIFMVQFTYENVNYDVETKGIELEDLEELLSGILTDNSPKEALIYSPLP